MDLSQRHRTWLVVFALVAIGAVFILASGISTLDLDYEAQPLPGMPPAEEEPSFVAPRITHIFDSLLGVLFAVLGALLPFTIILFLISPEVRKRAVRDLIILLVGLMPLYLIWRARVETVDPVEELPLPQGPPPDLPPAPQVVFAPEPRQWLISAATIAVALLMAALLVAIGWAIWRRRQRPSRSLDQLAQQAQDALSAIDAGADLRDTVTRCYLEMMRVLRDERGIHRHRAMTPREFEAQLEQVGIPTTQVRHLTRLFEAVRYGDKQLGEREERQAVVALTFIARFCRGAP